MPPTADNPNPAENLDVAEQEPKKKKSKKPWQARLTGSPVLVISILVHVLLGFLALFFVVQRIEEKRKVGFTETNVQSGSAAAQAQHQVQMTQKKNALTTPEITERITTTGLSNIVLPEIELPSEAAASATSGKLEGTALSGLGSGVGSGMGSGTGVELDAGSIAASAFGLSDGQGLGLTGRFYDLKQTRDRQPTGMTVQKYPGVIGEFVNSGWRDDFFSHYFVGPKPLYLPQMFTPYMLATNGPKAFSVQDYVQPKLWVVLYHGKIKVAHGGTYRFVGYGDDVCEVAIDHKIILDGSFRAKVNRIPDSVKHASTGEYKYSFPCNLPGKSKVTLPFQCGDWIEMNEADSYNIQVLVGEHPGGQCGFWIMIEEKGHSYQKTENGSPILPLFKLSDAKMPPVDVGCPPYDKQSLGWTMVDDGSDSDSGSLSSSAN